MRPRDAYGWDLDALRRRFRPLPPLRNARGVNSYPIVLPLPVYACFPSGRMKGTSTKGRGYVQGREGGVGPDAAPGAHAALARGRGPRGLQQMPCPCQGPSRVGGAVRMVDVLPALLVEREQGRIGTLVAGKFEGGVQRRHRIPRPRPRQLVGVKQGATQGAQSRIPKIQVTQKGHAPLRLHHRLVRPRRRRSARLEASTHRPRPLLRKRVQTRWRTQGHAHDHQPQSGTLVRQPVRGGTGA